MTRLIFAVLALAAPFLIYWFVVRPRLEARFMNLYSHIDNFWARWWARAVAFRTMVFGTIGLVLPELITAIASLASEDLTFLGDWWSGAVRGAALVAVMLSRAMATAPREEPPKG